jgi:hypothetical protein
LQGPPPSRRNGRNLKAHPDTPGGSTIAQRSGLKEDPEDFRRINGKLVGSTTLRWRTEGNNDIQKALDTAAGGANGDPVTRKLKATLRGGGCSFPSRRPAERWRSPPATPQARSSQEPESKPESDQARAPEPESKVESDLLWTPEPESKEESDLLWTPESESKKGSDFFLLRSPGIRRSPIYFGPQSPSPRGSPICFGLRGVQWTPNPNPKPNGLHALPCCTEGSWVRPNNCRCSGTDSPDCKGCSMAPPQRPARTQRA